GNTDAVLLLSIYSTDACLPVCSPYHHLSQLLSAIRFFHNYIQGSYLPAYYSYIRNSFCGITNVRKNKRVFSGRKFQDITAFHIGRSASRKAFHFYSEPD